MFIRAGGCFFCKQDPVVPPVQLTPSPLRPGLSGVNNEPKQCPGKPADLANVKCYRCSKMGHYALSHDKDLNHIFGQPILS